jgi:hypothetical protein
MKVVITIDSEYNACYTLSMKTAISLPDPLFVAAEQFAHERGLSRSELYAQALRFYLQTHQAQAITLILNQVYADESSSIEVGVLPAQMALLAREEW